jgi:predicted nucleic acid-binding protein
MSILSSDFERTLRKLKPEKRRHRLKPRKESELSFLGLEGARIQSLLYDTTVYVDILQGRFPSNLEAVLRGTAAWHSTVVECELASACALLDPDRPGTAGVMKQLTAVINRMPAHRSIAPDREIWRIAGVLTGTLARIQGVSKADRRRILNDALIFATARKHGHTVLTRNIVDFDFLQQLDPSGRVMFYKI